MFPLLMTLYSVTSPDRQKICASAENFCFIRCLHNSCFYYYTPFFSKKQEENVDIFYNSEKETPQLRLNSSGDKKQTIQTKTIHTRIHNQNKTQIDHSKSSDLSYEMKQIQTPSKSSHQSHGKKGEKSGAVESNRNQKSSKQSSHHFPMIKRDNSDCLLTPPVDEK